jgi:hypothetical protein
VPGTLTDPFQLFVIADFVWPFPLGHIFTELGKLVQPILPEKKPVDPFRVGFPQGDHGIPSADRQFIGQFITHSL